MARILNFLKKEENDIDGGNYVEKKNDVTHKECNVSDDGWSLLGYQIHCIGALCDVEIFIYITFLEELAPLYLTCVRDYEIGLSGPCIFWEGGSRYECWVYVKK